MSPGYTKERLLALLEHANRIASQTSLDTLLEQMLALMLVVAGAQTGTLYLLDRETDELVFEVIHGPESSKRLLGKRIPRDKGIVGACVTQREAIVVEDLPSDQRWFRDLDPQTAKQLRNTITFPLLLNGDPIGAAQVFNYQHLELEFLQALGNRMASEIEKARLLNESRRLSSRLQTLVDVIHHIGATLDRQALLQRILASAITTLEAKECYLYLQQEDGSIQRQRLQPFTQTLTSETIPPEQIPLVVSQVMVTRKTAILQMNGSQNLPIPGTKQVIAAPLLSPTIILGQDQGQTPTELLGALVAVNKEHGQFNLQDQTLLEALAQQAATVLRISDLYQTAQRLFIETIEALVAAIDAKDPYTQGHSIRVSTYSLAIGRRLGLSPEELHQLRIGSLLHDIGKIGVPDAILKKPGPLTAEEYKEVKKHPALGIHILEPVSQLSDILPAIAQHHERLDGSGYPAGLKGNEIHLVGRIVAVADVFDALTSERPYRKAMDIEEAFEFLQSRSGREFEPSCVQELIAAYQQGEITPPSRNLPGESTEKRHPNSI